MGMVKEFWAGARVDREARADILPWMVIRGSLRNQIG